MKVVQKKGQNKLTFSFGESQLNYAYEEASGKGDIDLYYGDLKVRKLKVSLPLKERAKLKIIQLVCGGDVSKWDRWCCGNVVMVKFAQIADKFIHRKELS